MENQTSYSLQSLKGICIYIYIYIYIYIDRGLYGGDYEGGSWELRLWLKWTISIGNEMETRVS